MIAPLGSMPLIQPWMSADGKRKMAALVASLVLIRDLGDFGSVQDLAAEHPSIFAVDSLRRQLRHRNKNGLAACCVTIGRKLLISKSRYESWLTNQAAG